MLFQDAFGKWRPESDPDFAVKAALEAFARDEHLPTLSDLLNDDSKLGVVEHEPGLELQRRRRRSQTDYAAWPEDAEWRAAVDPDAMAAAHPERFYTAPEMDGFIRTLMHAYLATDPAKAAEAHAVLRQLDRRAAMT